MVGLFVCAVGDASSYEGAVELFFVCGGFGGFLRGEVGEGGDLVGFADQGDFVGVFYYAEGVDGGFEG